MSAFPFDCHQCGKTVVRERLRDNRHRFCSWYCSDDNRLARKCTRKGKPPAKSVCVACSGAVYSCGTAGIVRQLCWECKRRMDLISRKHTYLRQKGLPAPPKQRSGAKFTPERIAYVKACLGYA